MENRVEDFAATQEEVNDVLSAEGTIALPFRAPALLDADERHDAAVVVLAKLHNSFDAVQTHVLLKQLEKVIEAAVEMNKEAAIAKMPTTNGKNVTESIFGATVTLKRGAKKWEYPNDAVLTKAEADLKAAKDAKSDREKFLQHLKNEVVDPQTGEVISPAKLISDGGNVISVELPK